MANKTLDPISLEEQAAAIDSGLHEKLGGVADAIADDVNKSKAEDAAMFAAFSGVAMGLLKAIRARVAKGLPEISKEWSDESLQVVADTIPPVINKYLAKLMPLVGDYPEEGALAMACLPLVMGYIAATGAAGKAANNEKASTEKASASEGE